MTAAELTTPKTALGTIRTRAQSQRAATTRCRRISAHGLVERILHLVLQREIRSSSGTRSL